MNIKRFSSLMMAAALTLTLSACSKSPAPQPDNTASPEAKQTQEQEQTGKAAEPAASKTEQPQAAGQKADRPAEQTMILGRLYQINLPEGQTPLIKGVKITGNQSGSGINGLPCAGDGIRSVFNLDEWMNFSLDTGIPAGEKIGVYAFVHNPDPSAYDKGLPGEPAAKAEGEVPAVWDDEHTMNFYVFHENYQPGYYDIVFVHNDKPLAKMMVKLFKDGELNEKTDAELMELMQNDSPEQQPASK